MRSLISHFARNPSPTPFFFYLPKVRLATTIRLCNLSSLMASAASDGNSTSSLVLCGKSLAENEIAKTIKTNNTLKLPDRSEISIILRSELDDKPLKEDSFRIDLFMNSLSTHKFGRFLIWSPRLSSTHDVLSALCITWSPREQAALLTALNFCELPIGAVCVADVQTKGRGRSKNVWESPLGCLLFSFTLQMEDGRVVPLVQYVVSLAITEAIKDICDKNGLPCVDVKIKWPNDLYLNGLKVGGILCTSTYKSKKFNISAGIGLNVNNEKPTTCLDMALRELSMKACQFQREDVLAAFFNKFEKFYDLFVNQAVRRSQLNYYYLETICGMHDSHPCLSIMMKVCNGFAKGTVKDGYPMILNFVWLMLSSSLAPCDAGFQALEQLYYKTWLHSGQRVIVQEKNEDKVVEHVVTIQGLTSSGYLLAIGDDNQMCELHPDGNSFDFFKGLVRTKLE